MPQRINGLKMELGNLPDEVLTSVHNWQVDRIIGATSELVMLEVEMETRGISYVPSEDIGRLVMEYSTDNQMQLQFDQLNKDYGL